MENKLITVTSPLLPDLNEFHEELRKIWDKKWITNNGDYHKRLESALAEYLGVPYISLFTNGTLPLITALQALRITGEVITTPYSFVATTHALWWNGIKPVFVDIDPSTGNLDPEKIEAAITPKTTAIMPVHVYGKPCDTKRIQEIADQYGLKVIYDAAHAFGVKQPPIPPKGGVLSSANPLLYEKLKENAIQHRKYPTEAESLMWEVLSRQRTNEPEADTSNVGNRKLSSFKFRRQHIIGDFIVDFVCLEKKTVIEIDGEYHNDPEQQESDRLRTQFLKDSGYSEIRFTNEEVLGNLDNVIERLLEFLNAPFRGRGARSVLLAGDISTLSFHATKVFNTIEGGAMVMHDAKMKQRIDDLKNFGFHDEVTVVAPGINSKMDEMRAAYGLLNLRQVDAAIAARKEVARQYVSALKDVEGISMFQYMVDSFNSPQNDGTSPFIEGRAGDRLNFSYFPIFIDAEKYGMTRDELYFKMKEANVLGRRYFYPLISEFSTYRGLESANPKNLPNAHKMADGVICLPIHHELSAEDKKRILELIIR